MVRPIDNVTRRVYVHSYTRRGRRQLRTRGAANADGGSAQAPTLSAFGCLGRRPSLADTTLIWPCSHASAWGGSIGLSPTGAPSSRDCFARITACDNQPT